MRVRVSVFDVVVGFAAVVVVDGGAFVVSLLVVVDVTDNRLRIAPAITLLCVGADRLLSVATPPESSAPLRPEVESWQRSLANVRGVMPVWSIVVVAGVFPLVV